MRRTYWSKRTIDEANAILNQSIFQSHRRTQKLYLATANIIIDRMTSMYLKIQNASESETVTRNFIYTYAGYMEMIQEVDAKLDKLGIKTNNLLSKNLIDLYEDNCKFINNTLEPTGINLGTKGIDKRAELASERIWATDGKHFSERIWGDTNKLKTKLAEVIPASMATGQGVMQMTYELQKDFSQDYSAVKRVVTTELTHIYAVSAQEQFKEAGFEEWEWSTSEDGKVCEDCASMNGKRFPINDTSHLPPEHPNCRCIAQPVIDIDKLVSLKYQNTNF